MPRFSVNRQAQGNGDHEVHDMSTWRHCHPNQENQVDLGFHHSCVGAVSAAKSLGYSRSNGCAHCASGCHTG